MIMIKINHLTRFGLDNLQEILLYDNNFNYVSIFQALNNPIPQSICP